MDLQNLGSERIWALQLTQLSNTTRLMPPIEPISVHHDRSSRAAAEKCKHHYQVLQSCNHGRLSNLSTTSTPPTSKPPCPSHSPCLVAFSTVSFSSLLRCLKLALTIKPSSSPAPTLASASKLLVTLVVLVPPESFSQSATLKRARLRRSLLTRP